MEYMLPAALILGVVLLVIAWLIVIIAGFRNHVITGLVALVPVLNWLIMPSIWHRAGKWALVGLFGFLLAVGAWLLGGVEQLTQHTKNFSAQVNLPSANASSATAPASAAAPLVPAVVEAKASTPATAVVTVSIPPAAHTGNAPAPNQVAKQATMTPLALPGVPPATVGIPKVAAESNTPAPPLAPTQDLPSVALYQLIFEEVEIGQLKSSQGKYVRITQKDGQKREGKVQAATGDEITLEERIEKGTATLPIRLSTVQQAAIMVRKQGK